MTIHILMTGNLHKPAVSRVSQKGKEFVTASVRAQDGEATTWASVICFDEAAKAELLRLSPGDALSVQGRAKLGVYEGKDGQSHASLDIVADGVLPAKPKPRPRAETGTKGRRKHDPRDPIADHRRVYGDGFDDPIPF
jgi:single-stranded DNA-binding protein